MVVLGIPALACLLGTHPATAAPVFGDRTDHEAGSGPVWVGAADVDGDGNVDLVVINESGSPNDHTIAVLRNDRTGHFPASAPPEDRYLPPFSPGIACFCDFDCDGDIDLVVSGSWENNGGVFALANDGTGHFALAQTVRPGSYAHDVYSQVVSGDFNSDGYPDLALSDETADAVLIFMNASCGSFASGVSYSTGSGTLSLCTSDLNGDGHLDLAVSHRASADVTPLMNDGTGAFTVGLAVPAKSFVHIASADLNGDHRMDLVGTDSDNDSVTVLINSGAGFGPPTSYYVPDGPKAVVLGDFDLDGHIDVATENYFSYNVSVLENDGHGGLLPPVNFPLDTPPYGPWWICGGDLDNDGDVDLAVANFNPGKVQVLRNLHCGSVVLDPCPFSKRTSTATGLLTCETS